MKYIIFITLSLILLLGFGCQNNPAANHTNTEIAASANPSKIQTVGVTSPLVRDFNSSVKITGTAMPNQMVKVFAMENGFVKNISKDIGDYVSKGTVIALLENPELDSKLKESEAHVKMAIANIQKQAAEKNKWEAISTSKKSIYDRLEKTYKNAPNIVLISDVENAKAEYETAIANVLSSEASIAAAKAEKEAMEAMGNAVRSRVNMLRIKAPFSGIITNRFVDNGATVQNGLSSTGSQPIVEVQDLSKIRLTVQVPESDVGSLEKGSEVKISFPELAGDDIIATISRTSNTLDQSSRTMKVEIDLDNQNNKIKPGMYAKVELNAKNRKGVLSLPIAAKKMMDDVPYILMVKNNRVEAIQLEQGLEGRDYFEVLNSGITDQSQIIIQGKNLVKAGQEVKATQIK
jgi:membrane fusion protein (multidrug efflux system)